MSVPMLCKEKKRYCALTGKCSRKYCIFEELKIEMIEPQGKEKDE